MNKEYFIYTHTSPSGNVYVGQTVNTQKRWGTNGEHYRTKKKDGKYVQAIFARAIDKYGWENFKHEILLDHQTKKEADYAEKYLISWYKQHGMSYNITNGGEGTCGRKQVISPERRKAISEFMKEHHPMKGKHHTDEAKQKISDAGKGRKLSEQQIKKMSERQKGMKHSEESKKKMREYKKSHPETWIGGWNKKEVHQYDFNGKYIASYPSATDAANALGVNISSDISNCVKGGIASVGGFFWRSEKLDYIDISNYKIVKTKCGMRVFCLSEEDRLRRSAAHGKAVNQYSLSGEYINTYCTASEASRQTKINLSGIQRCCKHEYRHKTAGGYLWEYDNEINRKNRNVA